MKFGDIKHQTHLSHGLPLPDDDCELKYEPWVPKPKTAAKTEHGRTYIMSSVQRQGNGVLKWQSFGSGELYWGNPGVEYGRVLTMTPCYTDRIMDDGAGAQQDQAIQNKLIKDKKWDELAKWVYVFAYKIDVAEVGSNRPMGRNMIIVGRDWNGGTRAGYAYAMDWIVRDGTYWTGMMHHRAPDVANAVYSGRDYGRAYKIHTR